MNILTVIILILICLIVVGMGVAMELNRRAVKRERALAVIRGQKGEGDQGQSEGSARDKRRAEIAKKLKESGQEEKKNKSTSMKARLRQAGMNLSVKKFYIFSLVFSLLFTVAVALMGAPKVAVPLLWFFGFIGLPRLFVRRKIKKRQQKFLEEFGDALEAMVRLLRAGMPVSEAIAMAGREFTGPVGEEMLQIYEAQKIGVPLPEATLEAAERMPLTEMQMFATAIAIQTQTGASLSEILTNLAGVIRARFRLKRKVQALSSEAKASAMIIGSLPFLVGSGLFFINRDYINLLFNTTPGIIMVIGGAVWMSLGILVMKIMINFKV